MNDLSNSKGVNPSKNMGVSSFPSYPLIPSSPFSFPSPPFLSLPLPFPLPSIFPPSPGGPTPKPARVSGEHCKLPSGVWGKAPANKRFGAYLGQKEQLCFVYLSL